MSKGETPLGNVLRQDSPPRISSGNVRQIVSTGRTADIWRQLCTLWPRFQFSGAATVRIVPNSIAV